MNQDKQEGGEVNHTFCHREAVVGPADWKNIFKCPHLSGGRVIGCVIQEGSTVKELGPALWATLKILFILVQGVKIKVYLAFVTEVTGDHTARARSEKSNPGVCWNMLFLHFCFPRLSWSHLCCRGWLELFIFLSDGVTGVYPIPAIFRAEPNLELCAARQPAHQLRYLLNLNKCLVSIQDSALTPGPQPVLPSSFIVYV